LYEHALLLFVSHGKPQWKGYRMRVTSLLWADAKQEGRNRVEDRLAEGERIAIVNTDRLASKLFAIVSVADLQALNALSNLRISQLASLLDGSRNQTERKSLVRLIDWLEKLDSEE
jgi:hypothetical protein